MLIVIYMMGVIRSIVNIPWCDVCGVFHLNAVWLFLCWYDFITTMTHTWLYSIVRLYLVLLAITWRELYMWIYPMSNVWFFPIRPEFISAVVPMTKHLVALAMYESYIWIQHMTLFDRSFAPCSISHYMAWIIHMNISNVECVIFSYPTWIYQRSCSNDKTPCSISHVWIVYMNTSNVILLVDSDSTEEYSFQQWHIATSHCTRFNRRFHGIIHGAYDFFLFDVNLSHRLLRWQWVICF